LTGAVDRCATGIEGLDAILLGGLPRNRLYLVQGDPGVGKTTLALQFLLEGLKNNERGLYVTLSETKDELVAVAKSHGWSLEGLSLFELSSIEERLSPEAQSTLLHPSEVELNQTTQLILDEVVKSNPTLVVFDSLSELRLLAQNPLRYRRQSLSLKQFFARRKCTVMLLDDRTSDAGDLQVQSLAHGVIALEQVRPEFGTERHRLSVLKVRGSRFAGGFHDYVINSGGLDVFPRLVAADHRQDAKHEPVSCGIAGLDALLGGGMHRGTSNLLIGPSGSGKSTLALHYALAAARRGEFTLYFAFDESRATMTTRAESIGLDLKQQLAGGRLVVQPVDPAEMTPGEFAHHIRRAVEREKARVVVLDSLNGYQHAMPDERFLMTQLHELLTYLGQQGVLTIMVLAQHGLVGQMESTVDLTYLADTVILLRYFESAGKVKKAISVIKKRSGSHEDAIREYAIAAGGARVGEPLTDFHGILTGTPVYRGQDDAMMRGTDAQRRT
jgi:circadian clock protein KaiC